MEDQFSDLEIQPTNSVPPELPPAEAAPPLPPTIAGFWRRFFAAIVDNFALGIVCFMLMLIFNQWAFNLGPWGRLVGLTFALPYFTLGASGIFGGQTAGKKLLGIKVIGADQQPLSLGHALLRTLALFLPFQLNGLPITEMLGAQGVLQLIIVSIQSIILFLGIIAFFYLMLFNRATRQGLHDLVARSYVVRNPLPVEAAALPSLPRKHVYVLGGLAALTLLLVLISTAFAVPALMSDQSPLQPVNDLYTTLNRDPRFHTTQVTSQTTFRTGGASIRSLVINVWLKEDCAESEGTGSCGDLARDIARQAFASVEGIEELDGMVIQLTRRADFGWATLQRYSGYSKTIEEWDSMLK